MFMKRNNNFLTIFLNNSYNFFFKKFNNISIDKSEKKKLINKNIKSLNHSTDLHTVWLLNLKKIYNLIKINLDLKNYHFLDVGCGNGIPLIYAYKKFSFNTFSGFDIIPEYVKNSRKNIEDSLNNKNINVFQADASEILLDDKSYFIFMFNPFDEIIMEEFIKNNYKNLLKNKSVIAYSNYRQLEVIKKFSKNIITIKRFKLAACFF